MRIKRVWSIEFVVRFVSWKGRFRHFSNIYFATRSMRGVREQHDDCRREMKWMKRSNEASSDWLLNKSRGLYLGWKVTFD